MPCEARQQTSRRRKHNSFLLCPFVGKRILEIILLCIFCGIRFGVVGCVCGKSFCEPFLVDLLEEEVGFGRFLWVFFWCVSVLVVAL